MIVRIKHYLFSPRFHFNRFQFNLVAIFFITVGLITGSYLTLSKIFPNVFATTSPWTQTDWSGGLGTSTTNQYSSSSSVDNTTTAGQLTLTNTEKLTNNGFENDLSGWIFNEIFLFKDEFVIDDPVPLTSLRTSEPGPGTMTVVDATELSIANGELVMPGSSITKAVFSGTSFAHAAGRAVLSRYRSGTNNDWVGWSGSNSNGGSARGALNGHGGFTTGSGYVPIGGGSRVGEGGASGTNLNYAIVRRASGGAWLIRDGKLRFVDNSVCTSNLYAYASTSNTNIYIDWLAVADLPYPYTNNYGLATQRLATAVVNDTLTHETDALIEGTWQAATGEILEIDIRRTDDNNRWIVRGDQVGNTIKLIERNAGIETERVSASQTWTNGTNYLVMVRLISNDIKVWVANSPKLSYTSATFNNTATQAKTNKALTNFVSWPYTLSGDALSIFNNYTVGLTPVRETTTTYSGSSGAARLTPGSNSANFYQQVNVGDTNTYNLVAYAKTDGSVVTSSDIELYYNGSTITTNYESVGGGWHKLSGTLTGANALRAYGVQIKANKTVYVDNLSLNTYTSLGTLTSNILDTEVGSDWGTLVYSATTPTNTSASVKVRAGNNVDLSDATDFLSCSVVSSGTDLTGECTPDIKRYVQYQVTLATTDTSITPIFQDISITFLTSDVIAPTTNASAITMTRSNSGTSVLSNGWTKDDSPYFSWTAGADDSAGSGLKGYCLYLGTDPDGNPATSKGLLGTSPVSIAGTTCQFIVSSTSIDFATSSYKGNPWLSTSSSPYYLNIKAIDNARNVYTGASTQFQFRFDNTAPTNISYASCASGNFSNVADMNFNWPTTGSAGSSDDNSGIFGWQYQINSTSGTWLGTTTESALGVANYLPTSESSRILTEAQDGSSIVSGNNIVYFRAVDAAGNISSDGTIRTCNLAYGGAAPAFGGTDTVTVTPSTSTSNSYALSWPEATATNGQTVTHYYYMINTSPPSTLATLQSNATTYIDNGTARTIPTTALANVNKGTNTVYVVAIDDASTPNYSPSNYITGTFTLNSTDPDNVGNLVVSDSSIKSQSQWNVTLTWTAPTYQGAGNLTYRVYRSTDGITFSYIGSTSGLSYVDNTPSSTLYYYKIYARDGADADSSGTNAVSITPTGKWTTAPTLDSEPTVGSITTKKATITWSTSRASDSKVQYGTTSGSYDDVEPSNSSQVTSHSIQLTGLNPGTTYYYKAKWTDEDGNTGISEEKSFNTAPAPTVHDVVAKNIGLTSSIIEFTSNNASKVKIYYGTTTSFGGAKEISTSTSESTYTAELTGLADGTKYYYKINTFDSDNDEYEGTVLDFTTLPRPKISNVRIQQVSNTAQPTILVTWLTNTEVSSIVTYYPEGNSSDARDEVNVALTKDEHQMIVRGLLPQTNYVLVVKGRDKIGNEAVSDAQRLTTATDTRPPQISELYVEGTAIPPTTSTAQESTAQLIVSWNTDEPSTSQVEFGEGTGTTYSSKTQEDSNLTFNHLVIISGLTPSKVYHLRAISKDKASNTGNSIDTVTITPKATENALNLVITNLQEAFSFIGGMKK